MRNYKVYWDNGAGACGTFPDVYTTEAEAEAAAEAIFAENVADGVWDESDAECEVVAVDVERTLADADVQEARDLLQLARAAYNASTVTGDWEAIDASDIDLTCALELLRRAEAKVASLP